MTVGTSPAALRALPTRLFGLTLLSLSTSTFALHTPQLSSTCPSQSLSKASPQTSIEACVGWQTSEPPRQFNVPAEQIPCRPVSHAAPPSGFPSSTCPLQSLSMPSHTSGET